ncbi:3-carboxy-cis,cis-muconate cycloisomerase [Mycobacterium heckeshornense]|uniref:3-carboxy-cis,cis-muconate cycloisomerase n=1 Tax=Mycobacterium heckeshornense TaxID=110505 RepID=A0A2G8B792_9MYCO|nr:lyase family protein [Mycobacterium heckeshornense]KMV21061.1 3-carboxy-cis,cis-muconate cycloisomerase [Mycobacterium heckeshornense]MCV7035975.1 3-carboxy-cis,cis-muconate cycloisomerase [Mycobacterium heckeshornense]PIJ33592.1 3-carboxy-cis,cis-muconate cycloisomerase [Mycobacterium heckeshornense]BCO36684.1 3-carboxy-cis,cis-muconate cycloisomerase [Mycobacterium heckeshornense]
MTNLLWPGDQRAGEFMTDRALLRSMVAVESAWLSGLADAGLAPAECAGVDLSQLVEQQDCDMLADAAEDGGNPVIGLVELLRRRAAPAVGWWIHRGLTSQDVVDTALMLGVRAIVDHLKRVVKNQISMLSKMAATHRHTAMVARTLTQPAVPTTFGAKAAGWLNGVVDAYDRLTGLTTPAQIGGAAGTLAATTELATLSDAADDPARISVRLVQHTAKALGLSVRTPWHTTRTPVTAAADALVGCTDAWGRIASDVVVLARPEIGELREPAGTNRGGSSTMPHKRNPVLSVLIRRAAVAAPFLAATLHTAAALANDERPDGSWHAEWDTLRTMARRTVVAGSHCSDLLAGLQIHSGRMVDNLTAAEVSGEQRAIADFVGKTPSPTYFGVLDRVVDDSLARAQAVLQDDS